MEILNFEGIQYLVRYPRGYEEGKKYPVILFLHGAGTRGSDIDILIRNPFFVLTDRHEDFPFVTVAPQCLQNETWFDVFERLKAFVRMVSSARFTDPDRLYVMGNSMGGYGTWHIAMSCPEYFAAAVPVCGGGMYWNAGRLVNLPIWAFHGDIDNVVSLRESENMVNTVNVKGGNARLTVYPNTKHDSWTATFSNPEVFAWLLTHRRHGAASEGDEFSDGKVYG